MSLHDRRGLVLAAAAIGAFCLATPDTLAKPKGRGAGQVERAALSLGADSPDPDASGTIAVRTARRGPGAVVRVRNLDPREDYLVVDGSTGEELGTLATNRRGRGRFSLGAQRGRGNRAASSRELPNAVEVVDPDTGETVLEGDVPGQEEEADYDYAFGYADYSSERGDYASVALSSFPEVDSESFYLSFFPVADEGDEHGCWCTPFYDFWAESSMGVELPLGVDSATDLAGRKFRLVDPDGNSVLEGTLPEMEEYDYDFPPCPGGDDPAPEPRDDGSNGHFRAAKAGDLPNGGARDVPPSDKPPSNEPPSEDPPGEDPPRDEPKEIRLEIAGDDGEFVDVGALNVYDPCDWDLWIPEDPWMPEDDWSDDWNGDWGDEWIEIGDDWMTGNGLLPLR